MLPGFWMISREWGGGGDIFYILQNFGGWKKHLYQQQCHNMQQPSTCVLSTQFNVGRRFQESLISVGRKFQESLVSKPWNSFQETCHRETAVILVPFTALALNTVM